MMDLAAVQPSSTKRPGLQWWRRHERRAASRRARPACAVTFRRGWRWASVEGDAELIGPDDPVEGVDAERLRILLREIFIAAGGTHDDWAEYDRIMAAERRAAVLVGPRRIYGTPEHPRG